MGTLKFARALGTALASRRLDCARLLKASALQTMIQKKLREPACEREPQWSKLNLDQDRLQRVEKSNNVRMHQASPS